MGVSIGSKILMPEGITLQEGVEIQLAFEPDVTLGERGVFGLKIELRTDRAMGSSLVINRILDDLPPFDDPALIAFKVAMREPNRRMFDAVFIAAADWYSRNYEFSLRREAVGTEDDYIVFEMREKDKPDGEVFATEPFLREWAEKYFLFP